MFLTSQSVTLSIDSSARSAATRDELNSIGLDEAVDLDLPIVSNEPLSVRRHDLDSMALVSNWVGGVIPRSGSMLKSGVSS
jgi:hypothetical protein